ncbi:MAG: efflux RND transporter periplasmic adaptor subunit [Burkholderiales bacterium]|nr:efflux RND transporter periplasmic adaptor subunit [Burkholderiales bacterium]MDE2075641.1 efflux RND transporter periplasmic adaptor subunit [Burkholderiales bacterium]MDE2432341.1 efflux RND transporter periplasmic adaptor subunit [Burkholderiales bacterium]
MSKKWWIALPVVLAVGLGIGYAWKHRPLDVTVTPVTRGPAIDAVYAAGSIEPTVTIPIASKVTGRLVALLADEGDTVRKGQVLAKLDAGDLQSSVDEALAREKLARAQYERTRELVAQHFLAQVELDRAKSDLDAAQATVKRAQSLRDYLSLTAPADGMVLRRDGEVGQVLTAGQVLMSLACCAPLRATVDVDEEDIGRVRKGQLVVLRADALPGQTLKGTVSEITPKGDPVSRSYRVRIQLDRTQGLLAGMTVEANLVVTQRDNALLVPSTAVVKDSVWIMQDGRAHQQAVKIGIAGTSKTEILSGLPADAKVVTVPPADLTEGRALRAGQP